MSLFDVIKYPIRTTSTGLTLKEIKFINNLPPLIYSKWNAWGESEDNLHPRKHKWNERGYDQLRKIILEYEE